MRPDSIDSVPDPIKTDPIARVNPSRRKDREERDREAEELGRKNRRGRHGGDPAPEEPEDREGESSPTPRGSNPKRGHQLDLLV